MSNRGILRFFTPSKSVPGTNAETGTSTPKTTTDTKNINDENKNTNSKASLFDSVDTETPMKLPKSITATPKQPTKTATSATTPKPTPATKRKAIDNPFDEDIPLIPTTATPIKTNTPSKRPTNPADDDDSEDEIIVKKPVATKRAKYQESSSEEETESSDETGSDYSESGESSEDDNSDSYDEESEDEAPKKAQIKRSAPAKKNTTATKTRMVATESEEESDYNQKRVAKPIAMSTDQIEGLFNQFTRAAPTHLDEQEELTTKTNSKQKSYMQVMQQMNEQAEEDEEEDEAKSEEETPTTKFKASQKATATTQAPQLVQKDYSLPSFVDPAKIKDKKGRRPDHPDYDERTLYIPEPEFKDMTPLEAQYWKIKQNNMDVTLFFKVGKFYELFDIDAEVGVRELGLLRMGSGARLHVGFPEIGYAKYATILSRKGYKVACAEQTQTPEQMKAANLARPKGTPVQKAVDRHICSVVTPGTATSEAFIKTPYNKYLVALVEVPLKMTQEGAIMPDDYVDEEEIGNESGMNVFNRIIYHHNDVIYGVCCVDTSTGLFNLSSFADNSSRTALRTLLANWRPSEMLLFKNNIGRQTSIALHTELPPECVTSVVPGDERFSPTNCIQHIHNHHYFNPPQGRVKVDPLSRKAKTSPLKSPIDPQTGWPDILQQNRNIVSQLTTTPNKNDNQKLQAKMQDAFWSALGLLFQYLKRILLDKELIPLCRFNQYNPLRYDDPAVRAATTAEQQNNKNMMGTDEKPTEIEMDPMYNINFDSLRLESQTLTNLEVLTNTDGGIEGTLLSYIDHCQTSFGKRLLKRWVACPLGHPTQINERLDAIDELLEHPDIVKTTTTLLAKIPDLERILSRIRVNATKREIKAIMYENIGKIQVETFLKCLDGFEEALKAVHVFINNRDKYEWKSRFFIDNHLVKSTPSSNSNEEEDDDEISILAKVEALITNFRDSFDHKQAKTDGRIIPRAGIADNYDDSNKVVTTLEAQLNQILRDYQKMFSDNKIQWIHKGKETYQLEIPIISINARPKLVTSDFSQLSSTAKVRRFHTPEIKILADKLDAAKTARDTILQDVTRQVFEKFSNDNHLWTTALESISALDCIISLSKTATTLQNVDGIKTSRPVVMDVNDTPLKKPMIQLRQAVHPTVVKNAQYAQFTDSIKHYVANDVDINTMTNPSEFLLVSGPNMGGKSTILRKICSCIILAQIGCYVPAESMHFTPVDQIFTRVGANDRIMQGQSTFLVELDETSQILRHATPRSFVILDELGRGTSTFDGTAIAYAVIQYLSTKTRCMTLFSTHYHMLLEEFKDHPSISMYHMSYQVKSSPNTMTTTGNAVKEDEIQSIQFLYKFIPGACDKSFGLHVASLAKLPTKVIQKAHQMSQMFEQKLKLAHSINANSPVDEPTDNVLLRQEKEKQQRLQLLKKLLVALDNCDSATLVNLKARSQ